MSANHSPGSAAKSSFFRLLDEADRRIIYLFVAISLSLPIILDIQMSPAAMSTADAFFESVDKLERAPGKIVLIAADWGPGTLAENKPQTMLAIEHLMRKRIPFALISIYNQAAPFLDQVPKEVVRRLEEEFPGETWKYGEDWVNWGFRPGGILMIQQLAKSANLHEALEVDAEGTPISALPAMRGVRTIKDISMLMEFTGLVGAFNYWVQYFSGPPFVHGCTSITIPEAFIFFSSGQIIGLLEGLAGAARYEQLLYGRHEARVRPSLAIGTNTGLSFAQLVVIAFILLGNAGMLLRRWGERRQA